ncbi:MAG: hypothetical protein E2O68_00970 [Deltaproteobacteria bacterium]|nr:MAG: hypothetical protein E2O68_00970 [Deltaproteobacteria bacterium]
MKKFLIIFIFLMPTAWANPILECLGQEELLIHKNEVVGPIKYLNLQLVNNFASFSNITIKKAYLNGICKNPDYSPSVALLKDIMLNGMDLYVISREENQQVQDVATIESFLNEIPHIFFSYLSKLQNEAATPDCLAKRVKHLKEFTDNIFYLESESSARDIFQQKKKVSELFEDLQNLDKFWKDCKKEALAKKAKK